MSNSLVLIPIGQESNVAEPGGIRAFPCELCVCGPVTSPLLVSVVSPQMKETDQELVLVVGLILPMKKQTLTL